MPAWAAVSWCCSRVASVECFSAAATASAADRCAAVRAASARCSRSCAASPILLHVVTVDAASVDALAASASASAAFLCSLSCRPAGLQRAGHEQSWPSSHASRWSSLTTW